MKRHLFRAFAFLLLLTAFCAPVLAATKTPWQHQAEEFYIDANARHDSASGDTLVGVNFGWQHYVTDNLEVGAALSGLFAPSMDGALLGPSMTYNFVRFGCRDGAFCKGNLVFGGDASMTSGDLTDEAAARLATWFGAKVYQGQSSAISLLANATRAVSPGDAGSGGANALDSYSATIRLSFGVPQSATP